MADSVSVGNVEILGLLDLLPPVVDPVEFFSPVDPGSLGAVPA